MHDRSEWIRWFGPPVVNGRVRPELVEFSRPCATCGKMFAIFVTERIASGQADTNNFALKNCELHRRKRACNNS